AAPALARAGARVHRGGRMRRGDTGERAPEESRALRAEAADGLVAESARAGARLAVAWAAPLRAATGLCTRVRSWRSWGTGPEFKSRGSDHQKALVIQGFRLCSRPTAISCLTHS